MKKYYGHDKKTSHTPRPKNKTGKPRKRLIYDDFGEPLRWVWVEAADGANRMRDGLAKIRVVQAPIDS